MFLATLTIALTEIRANLMRSILTTLGIIIGVAAVIVVASLGAGATQKIESDLSSLGNNLIVLVPGTRGIRGSGRQAAQFSLADVNAIREQVPFISQISPGVVKGAVAVSGGTNHTTQVYGVQNSYFDIRSLTLAGGRIFTDAEQQGGRPVCVIGETVREDLFGVQNPLGATIRITADSSVTCTIIGLLDAKGATGLGADQDDVVIAPLLLVQRRLIGNRDISQIYMTTLSEDTRSQAIAAITDLMRERRHISPGEEDDFWIRDLKEIQQQVSSTVGLMTVFVAAIAAISLLVGGIGVMNIMLVSVTERTREIGIRLAVGAQQINVLVQFLVEAVVLSLMGGLIGIAAGAAISYLGALALKLPFVLSDGAIAIAFFFSALIGIAFGFFPAFRAARLNPIDALRYE